MYRKDVLPELLTMATCANAEHIKVGLIYVQSGARVRNIRMVDVDNISGYICHCGVPAVYYFRALRTHELDPAYALRG